MHTSVVGSSGRQQGLSGYAVSPYVSAGSSHPSTFFGRSCSAASPSNELALCGPAEPEITQNYNQQNVQNKFISSGCGNHKRPKKIRKHDHHIKSTSLRFSQCRTSITKNYQIHAKFSYHQTPTFDLELN